MTVVSIKPQANQETVELLEEMLADAKSGEIQSVMAVCERRGSKVSGHWTACEDLFVLAGNVARMQHRIQCRLDEGVEVMK